MAIPMSTIGASMVLSNMSMNRNLKGGGSLPPENDDDDKNDKIWRNILIGTIIAMVFVILVVIAFGILFKYFK